MKKGLVEARDALANCLGQMEQASKLFDGDLEWQKSIRTGNQILGVLMKSREGHKVTAGEFSSDELAGEPVLTTLRDALAGCLVQMDQAGKLLFQDDGGWEQTVEDGIAALSGLVKLLAKDKEIGRGYSLKEMESAVEIACIAGRYGYRTLDSRDAPAQFISWAKEIESMPYDPDEWLDLIEVFAASKMRAEVEAGRAEFDEKRVPGSLKELAKNNSLDSFETSFALAREIASGKAEIIEADERVKRSFTGPILATTHHHVVQSVGREAVIYKASDLSKQPENGQVVTIDFALGHGIVYANKQAEAGIER